MHYQHVAKEATAIINAIQIWEYILWRHFTIITDKKYVDCMLDNRKLTKIKNNQIQGWRFELASFSYILKNVIFTEEVKKTVCSHFDRTQIGTLIKSTHL